MSGPALTHHSLLTHYDLGAISHCECPVHYLGTEIVPFPRGGYVRWYWCPVCRWAYGCPSDGRKPRCLKCGLRPPRKERPK